MIMLVLLMPFYSASALATYVSVTQSHGTANIDGFLDVDGDTWTVEAVITDAPAEVVPENVKLVVGSRDAQFESCSSTDLGTICTYASPLEDGIPENTYPFHVVYENVDINGVTQTVRSVTNSVTADGSSPSITFRNGDVSQNVDGTVDITFSVTDRVSTLPAVGLQSVEIVDADTGTVLQTMVFDESDEEFLYNGKLEAELTGAETKHIKIRASDILGHETTSVPVSFKVDYVAPVIQKETLNFTSFGRFIGETSARSNIVLDITDTSNAITVTATSADADLDNDIATCVPKITNEERVYTCTWKDVLIFARETITLSITAEDKFGNSVTESVPTTFVPDTDAPIVTFFGTNRVYNDQTYARSGDTKVILIVQEQGSGITQDTIIADVSSLGGSSNAHPTECGSVEGTYICYWDISSTSLTGKTTAKIYLVRFEDGVGNEGVKPSADIVVDTVKPVVIGDVGLFGVSNGQEKEYVQSNDELMIKVQVQDRNGVRILADMNNVIMDAKTEYPAGEFTEDGWAEFTEESCERAEDDVTVWDCTLLTKPVKSGYDKVNFKLVVEDTAGNKGYDKSISFELLGLDEEIAPDYWQVEGVNLLVKFIDISSTELAPLRMPVTVELSAGQNVELLQMEPLTCDGGDEAPVISNIFMYGASIEGSNTAKPTLLLEFEQFDGLEYFNVEENEDVAEFPREYNCTIQIYSRIDKNALLSAEMQNVPVTVKFALSELGAQDQALQDKIDDARDVAMNKGWSWTNELLTVLDWIGFVNNLIVKPLISILEAIDIIKLALETPSKTILLNAPATSACVGLASGSGTLSGVTSFIQGVTGILTCNEQAFGFLGEWHGKVLDWYNYLALDLAQEGIATGFVTEPRQVRSIQDNFLVSVVGLCLPGVIRNLDEMRQIACRKVYCLETEVKSAGVPVSVCEQLESQMVCKYVTGEVLEFLPWVRGIDVILQTLKRALQDWVGFLTHVPTAVCGIICPTSPAGAGICNGVQVVEKLVDVLSSVTSALESKSAIGKSYCSLIE